MIRTPRPAGKEDSMSSWGCDGTRAGCDTFLLDAVSGFVSVPAVDSGPATRPDHLYAGANAVLAASTFHDGDSRVADINQVMTPNNCESDR